MSKYFLEMPESLDFGRFVSFILLEECGWTCLERGFSLVCEAEMQKLETELRHLRNDLLYKRLSERDIWRVQQHASQLLKECSEQAEEHALRVILDLLESIRRTQRACGRLNQIRDRLRELNET